MALFGGAWEHEEADDRRIRLGSSSCLAEVTIRPVKAYDTAYVVSPLSVNALAPGGRVPASAMTNAVVRARVDSTHQRRNKSLNRDKQWAPGGIAAVPSLLTVHRRTHSRENQVTGSRFFRDAVRSYTSDIVG